MRLLKQRGGTQQGPLRQDGGETLTRDMSGCLWRTFHTPMCSAKLSNPLITQEKGIFLDYIECAPNTSLTSQLGLDVRFISHA